MSDKYDVTVIGAGPGGYTAAIRAAQLGAKVLLVEKDEIGGTCLNRGCIPTKALLACAENLRKIKKAGEFGINVKNISLDFGKMQERKNSIVAKIRKGLEGLIRGSGIVIEKAESRKQKAEHGKMIIATGSEPAEVKGFKIDGKRVLNSTQVLELTEIPKSIAIIGGGVMGVEFASLFCELESEVTIIEMLERLLPEEDEEISKTLERIFKRKGIKIELGAKLDQSQINAEKIVLTIGRKFEKIEVNEKMETKEKGVYAVGDVTGKNLLAHVAMAQGRVAAENAMGKDAVMDYSAVPMCVYSIPEVARAGNIRISGDQGIKEIRVPFAAIAKANCEGEIEGFIKLFTEGDKIVGATMIGPHVTELVHEIALAIRNKLSLEQISQTIHAHPTLSEGIFEGVEKILGKSIHLRN